MIKIISKIFTALIIAVIIIVATTIILNGKIVDLPDFDGLKAFDILKKQCDFGPRPVGTKAHEQTKEYLCNELSKYADKVELQKFTYFLDGENKKLTNIIGKFGDTSKASILLCAHWDTRPIADRDRDPKNRNTAISGANDGASGVAVLLELARLFKLSKPHTPVTIILFDGEDYGPTGDDMFIGSRYFATKYDKKNPFKMGILLDMVGDIDLNIYREGYSQKYAKKINDIIWSEAEKLGYQDKFINRVKYTINDDHLPLFDAGIPCIDIIDFDYRYWHTIQDTTDKCSSKSLKIVGDVIRNVVYDL